MSINEGNYYKNGIYNNGYVFSSTTPIGEEKTYLQAYHMDSEEEPLLIEIKSDEEISKYPTIIPVDNNIALIEKERIDFSTQLMKIYTIDESGKLKKITEYEDSNYQKIYVIENKLAYIDKEDKLTLIDLNK